MGIGEGFFSEGAVLQWHSCPGSAVASVLEVFQQRCGTEGCGNGHVGGLGLDLVI